MAWCLLSSQAGSEEEASKSEEDQKEASDKERRCEFNGKKLLPRGRAPQSFIHENDKIGK